VLTVGERAARCSAHGLQPIGEHVAIERDANPTGVEAGLPCFECERTASGEREREPNRIDRDRNAGLTYVEQRVLRIEKRLFPNVEARTRSVSHQANV
jgi:hypothetical protein